MDIQHAEILFPTCGPEGRMNKVRITAYPERHNAMRSCPDASKVAQVKHLISYCRDGEDIDTLDIDVVVQFEDDAFEGQSFGLALALADKRARFRGGTDSHDICATGVIENKGRIEPIEHFPEKLVLAANTLVAGAIFVFPRANRKDDPDGLADLQKRGVSLIEVEQLAEVGSLWTKPTSRSHDSENSSHTNPIDWLWLGFGTIIGFLFPTGAAAIWLFLQTL